jgi:hypothetical protein
VTCDAVTTPTTVVPTPIATLTPGPASDATTSGAVIRPPSTGEAGLAR